MTEVELGGYFEYAEPMDMTGVSLFAGVGGFDLAMERNGVKVVATSEIDKHARAVLQRRFPTALHLGDIKEITGEQLIKAGFVPSRGIITGGFPCQDLSVAGKRMGFSGQRSSLFYQIARLADETQAEWLVLENVPGLLTSQRGADMGAVVGTLVECGYGLSWRVLDAQYFGVPQRRRRVFIIARRSGNVTSAAKVLFEREGMRGDFATSRATWQETAGATGTGSEGSVSLYEPHHGDGRETVDRANTLNARMGTGGNNQPVLVEKVFVETSFAGYTEGTLKTLNATQAKRGTENVVVRQDAPSAEQ